MSINHTFWFRSFAIIGVCFRAVLSAQADAVYSNFPTNAIMTPGLSFFTEMRVVTTSNAVGAFSVSVRYDPRIIQIQAVALPSGSAFLGNTFADGSSFQSGQTRIVGFRTTNSVPHPEGETAFYIVWRTVGTTVRKTAITNVIESNVDSAWKATEVWPSASTTAALDETDTDGDGLPNWWEQLYFGGTTNAVAGIDSDNDGLTNLQDYQAGTSPLDAASVLEITKMELVGANVVISFPTILGRDYSVERVFHLKTNDWSTVGATIVGTGNTESVTDINVVGTQPIYFYRVRIAP